MDPRRFRLIAALAAALSLALPAAASAAWFPADAVDGPSPDILALGGIDVAADPLEAKRRIGYCPDVGGLIPRATPWEHLQLSARLRGLRDWEPRARQLLDQFDLGGEAHRVTAGFSHGMGRRMSVALAVSLMAIILPPAARARHRGRGIVVSPPGRRSGRAAGGCRCWCRPGRSVARRRA